MRSKRLLQVPDVSRSRCWARRTSRSIGSTERLAGLRLNLNQIVSTLQAQNLVRPAGTIQASRERVFLRVSGRSTRARHRGVNIVAGDRMFRLGDIATVRRGFVDPPQPMFRVNGKPDPSALPSRCATPATSWRSEERPPRDGRRSKADMPVGIEPVLVADQAVTVDLAIGDFAASLWQAIVDHPRLQLRQPGRAPGAVVALAIPLTLAIVFAVMDVANIDLHRISLGALIIALALLVDDAMTTVDAMLRRLGAGDTRRRGHLRLPHAGRADADRHAGDDFELRADRLFAELGRRVHVLDLPVVASR